MKITFRKAALSLCSSAAALLVLVAVETRSAWGIDTARVQSPQGVPQLVIDGRPVRARIFWGGPGTRPLRIEPNWQEVMFEFVAKQDATREATMHFRFGDQAGAVELDNIRVTRLDGNRPVLAEDRFSDKEGPWQERWSMWPPGAQNTVGRVDVGGDSGYEHSPGLHIELNPPAEGDWPDFHIYARPNLTLKKGRRYRVSFRARATPTRRLTVAFYRPGKKFTFLGGPDCFEPQIRMAAEVGVDIVSFPVPLPWPETGADVDWESVDRRCQTALDANPRALLLPRIGMTPPVWWRRAHEDCVMQWDSGTPQHPNVVVASPTYRDDASRRLRDLVLHLERKFGPHMAGYHPCGQNTGEWFYEQTWGTPVNGYSPASRIAWQKWLSARYPTDADLKSAWHNADATLAKVAVPSAGARHAAPAGTFRDPATEQSLIDFADFQQQMMAECVCRFAATVRRATEGRKLVVFFYGYVFEFGAIRNGPATSGHYALRRVLDSPDIDLLCSPISYFDRGIGESGPAMTAAESVALAGKMWLFEDDTRTYLATGRFPGWQSGVDTLEASRQLLLRNTGQCAVRGFGTWWMDLGSSGWFQDRRLWDVMTDLRTLDDRLLKRPMVFRPEIAAVVDQRSMLRVAAGGDTVTRPSVYEARRALARVGAPYGQYLLDDVLAGKVKAKLFVFLNAWCLTAEQRTRLHRVTDGSLCVWSYAPGYFDGDRVSVSSMQQLTGFRLRPVTLPVAIAEPTTSAGRTRLLNVPSIDRQVTPLFAAGDAEGDEVLAKYSDGSAAIALRSTGDRANLFVGPPGLTSDLLRLAARRAGVHLYTPTDCNVYANGPFVILHAATDGPLRFDSGSDQPIRDLITGRTLGVGPRIELDVKRGDTRILTVERR